MQLTFELSDLISLINEPANLKKEVIKFTALAMSVSKEVQTLVIDKMNEIKESHFSVNEDAEKRLEVLSFENYGQPGYF